MPVPYTFTNVGNPTADATQVNANFNAVDSRVFNVLSQPFGAVGDGTTDDTAAIQAAITAAIAVHGTVLIPNTANGYKVTSLSVSGACGIRGHDASNGGSTIFSTSTTLTTPILDVISTACTIADLRVLGQGSSSQQDCIRVTTCDNVYLRNLTLDGGNNLLNIIDGFFSWAQNVTFLGCNNAQIKTSGTTAGGVAWNFLGCQSLPPASGAVPKYMAFMDNVGSIVMDSFICSPNNCTQGGLIINTLASAAGVSNFSNCQFEPTVLGPAVGLVGTVSRPIRFMYFDNCYIGGGTSGTIGALDLTYAQYIGLSNCYLTGPGRTIWTHNVFQHARIANCTFQPTSVCFGGDNGAVIGDIIIRDPMYGGGNPFYYIGNVAATDTGTFTIDGGDVGTNGTPVAFNQTTGVTQKVNVPGFNKGLLAAPAIPASTVALINPFFVDCLVRVNGGTVTDIKLDGVSLGITSGLFLVPAGHAVSITYSVVPTSWTWTGM